MDDLSEKLHKLGDAVSDTAERLSDPSELDAARRLWTQPRARAASRARRPFILLSAAACLVALVVALVLVRPGSHVSFVVGVPPARGAIGDWVAADPGAPLPMRFSE